MKTLGKLIAAALAVGLTPFRFKSDRETGAYEVGGLLWSLKKTPGEEADNYTLELLPFIGGQTADAEASLQEEPAGEAAAPAAEPEQAEE